jgi:uncharacterized protein YehS (DUF1456 family)
MENNDILRRLRFVFDYDDDKMMKLFSMAGKEVTRAEVSSWMKREDAEDYLPFRDINMAYFLNGLIIEKRGKREGPLPKAEKSLTNNIIFRKLKIALNYKDEDILAVLKLADLNVSKHELSAIFRKPGQRQYRACKDQFLRNFLMGLQLKYRD